MPLPVKDFLVIFTEHGEVESTKDITNPSTAPRKRRIVVRATTAGKAEKAAQALYSYAE